MKKTLLMLLSSAMLLSLSSCLGDDETEKYSEWKNQNENYVYKAEIELNPDGTHLYTRVVPDWASGIYVLMRWHNDRALTENRLSPLDNSTCDVKYIGELIDGTQFDTSFANKDSLYTTQPYRNIPGFWTALKAMHVGDSTTVVIPWQAAYGSNGNGTIKPFSTLIFHMKLKGIPKYEIPS